MLNRPTFGGHIIVVSSSVIRITDELFAKWEFLGVFLTSTHAPTKRPASRHQSVPRAAYPQEADPKVKLT